MIQLANRKLPHTSKQSTVITILKPNKDSVLPSSYCPILLLNQGAKIFTAALANRVKMLIPKYIHNDQTGLIPEGILQIT